MNGTLALIGSGEYLPPMNPVDEWLLGRLRGQARVVCLPSAAGQEGPERIGYWSRLGVDHFTRLGATAEAVEIVNRAGARDEALAARIRAANFVYLSGGDPDYLYQTLNGTPAWAAIEGVLAGGGVVAGCSAGAIIWSESYPSFPTLVPWRPAFNYLPGAVVLPHYDEFGDSAFVKLLRPLLPRHLTILGVEANTALVRYDGKHEVRGAGGVTVWNSKRKVRLTEGALLTWP